MILGDLADGSVPGGSPSRRRQPQRHHQRRQQQRLEHPPRKQPDRMQLQRPGRRPPLTALLRHGEQVARRLPLELPQEGGALGRRHDLLMRQSRPPGLLHHVGLPGAGLRLRRHPKARQRTVQQRERRAARQPQPHLEVHGHVVALVERSRLVQQAAADEDGRLRDQYALSPTPEPRQQIGPLQLRPIGPQQFPCRVDAVAVPHQHLAGGICERLHHLLEAAGPVDVVGVQVGEDLALTASQAFVDGVSLPPVGFRHPVQVRIALQHGDGAVGRAAVDHPMLERAVPLIEYGPNGRLDRTALVVGRRDDGDQRRTGHRGRGDARRVLPILPLPGPTAVECSGGSRRAPAPGDR